MITIADVNVCVFIIRLEPQEFLDQIDAPQLMMMMMMIMMMMIMMMMIKDLISMQILRHQLMSPQYLFTQGLKHQAFTVLEYHAVAFPVSEKAQK